MVDFALTPNALERLYAYLRPETSGRLVAVFGGTGRRDRSKRPKMTEIVGRYADEIILTRDEPYDDPEEQIYTDLERGLVNSKTPHRRVEDRKEALRQAIAAAKEGDTIAVTGMGNYNTMAIGDKQIPWNDRKVIEELIRELLL